MSYSRSDSRVHQPTHAKSQHTELRVVQNLHRCRALHLDYLIPSVPGWLLVVDVDDIILIRATQQAIAVESCMRNFVRTLLHVKMKALGSFTTAMILRTWWASMCQTPQLTNRYRCRRLKPGYLVGALAGLPHCFQNWSSTVNSGWHLPSQSDWLFDVSVETCVLDHLQQELANCCEGRTDRIKAKVLLCGLDLEYNVPRSLSM